MIKTILIWTFAFACVGALVFGLLKVRVLFGQRFRRRRVKRAEESPAFSVPRLAQDCPIPTKSRRGYDCPEIFRKDTLVRIKILQARIQENAERINRITQRMKQQRKVYNDRTKRLEDEDESE